jgi:hypothetical protein
MKAITAPMIALRFQPPCHRGRLGRTYPGGAVVPFRMVSRRVHFNNGKCKVNILDL